MSQSLLIRSIDGKPYRVTRAYVVDMWLDDGSVTVRTIKGARTIPIDDAEYQKIDAKLREWDEDEYASA